MKSMNSGTPASVALPERSSLGMMRSTSRRTVSHSCAVKFFGSYGAPRSSASRASAEASRTDSGAQRNAVASGATASRPTAERLSIASPIVHSSPRFMTSAMCSLVRSESARIVQVGFLSACDTNGPPSVTNRFLQSCAWHQRLSTEVFGSSPMRMPPSSWMMVPPGDAVAALRGGHGRKHLAAHFRDQRAERLLHVLHLLVLVVRPLPVELEHRDAPAVHHARVELAVGV